MKNKSKYWLAPHVVGCSTHGGAVFLDLSHSRYYRLDTTIEPLLCTLLHEWNPVSYDSTAALATMSEGELTNQLIEKGLITSSPSRTGNFLQRHCVVAGDRTIDEPSNSEPIKLTHAVQLVQAHRWAQRAIRTHSLLDIAASIASDNYVLNLNTSQRHLEAAVSLTHVFRKLRPWIFSARGKCLLHALTLTRYLSAFGVQATWMIGVRLCPWAAHSWVQLGPNILDSTPEEVALYTPILSV
jgi:hypothetical protein